MGRTNLVNRESGMTPKDQISNQGQKETRGEFVWEA